jgi:hypothetical protein
MTRKDLRRVGFPSPFRAIILPERRMAVYGVEIRCAQISVHAKIRKFLAYFLIKRIKRYSAELCASAEWLELLRSFLRKALVFVY